MGIKVLDNIFIDRIGLTVVNLMLSFRSTYRLTYNMVNNSKVYVITANLYYYIDRSKDAIYSEQVSFTINDSQLETNLVEYMYNMIKSRYTNYENV